MYNSILQNPVLAVSVSNVVFVPQPNVMWLEASFSGCSCLRVPNLVNTVS